MLRYTDSKPTQPGHYFMRFSNPDGTYGRPQVFEVKRHDGQLYVGPGYMRLEVWRGFQYAGPIELPLPPLKPREPIDIEKYRSDIQARGYRALLKDTKPGRNIYHVSKPANAPWGPDDEIVAATGDSAPFGYAIESQTDRLAIISIYQD